MSEKKTYCFDIDRTLCEPVKTVEEYATVAPKLDMIEFVNQLFREGHTVYLYTGRHTQQALVTRRWLEKHDVEYHHLFLGKPVADVYIDDLAIRYTNLDEVKDELKKFDLI